MDDATQKLLDEARGWLAEDTDDPATEVASSRIVLIVKRLADALEAAERQESGPDAPQRCLRCGAKANKCCRPHAQRPPVEHPAHSGHEFGGAYARAAALAAGDPDWTNATGGKRPPVSPEVREALDELIADVLVAERDEWPRDPGDAPSEVLAGAVTDAILARFSLPVLDAEKVAGLLYDVWNTEDGNSVPFLSSEARVVLAAALVAAIQNGELT